MTHDWLCDFFQSTVLFTTVFFIAVLPVAICEYLRRLYRGIEGRGAVSGTLHLALIYVEIVLVAQ